MGLQMVTQGPGSESGIMTLRPYSNMFIFLYKVQTMTGTAEQVELKQAERSRQSCTGRAEQAELHRQSCTGRAEQAERNRQSGTGRAEQAERNRQRARAGPAPFALDLM